MKKGIRILAIDGSAFSREEGGDSLAVGVVGREGEVEGVISFCVGVDGDDATGKIIKAVKGTRFREQIRLIAVHGITLAGLNFADLVKINSDLGIPVVGIVRSRPRAKELEKAIRASGTGVARKLLLFRKIHRGLETVKYGGFYFQCVGIKKEELADVSDEAVRLLRLAHLIASGVRTGESKGRM
jgi:endonuclease V-like protein UPF0215 family